MTDREMLEMAAKAAGIEIDPIDALHAADAWMAWNPLTDDGDALRLAVTLRLDVHFEWQYPPGHAEEIVEVFGPVREDGGRHCPMEWFGSDPYAATRRAIVLAAAEIGRAML